MSNRGKRWYWVWAPEQADGRFHDVGIDKDGSLYNPNGYPEGEVRAAIAEAEQRRKEKRSRAAKKAAETRRKRREAQVYEVAKAILGGRQLLPSMNCRLCGRGMSDEESRARAIGPECWQGVLEEVERLRQGGAA
ncbi:MAG: DUF6011 domain-containing protein [Aestuariivita sp.]|uniref:DUF6011 domain-containing protein n=1 Tax=Aestuariivita sp. TaxID=1872407 RepID=UPI003BB1AA3F